MSQPAARPTDTATGPTPVVLDNAPPRRTDQD